jgi:hypothetical protein
MVHTDDIPADALHKVIQEVTDLVDRGLEDDLRVEEPPAGVADLVMEDWDGNPLRMQDSFYIYKLEAKALEAIRNSRAEGDLSKWVTPADQIFHQIFLLGQPKAFARSKVLKQGAEGKTLNQLNVSPLAGHIEDGLKKIKEKQEDTLGRIREHQEYDQVFAADPVIRMLDLPSYHILALWIYAETLHQSRVLLLLAPKRYRKSWTENFLTTEQFFEGLRDLGPLGGTA